MAECRPREALRMVAAMAVCCGVWQSLCVVLPAADPPAVKPPRIALLSPLGVLPGQKTRVILRGWSLKDPTAVVVNSETVRITVVSHAAAPIPGKQKAEQIGDEQLELDVEVPAEHAAGPVQVVVRTAVGESLPHRMPIGSLLPLLQEQEPNDGFRQAQQVTVPQLISGSIHADTNVDVYAFELSQPAHLQIHVEAAELGSNLDALLTLLAADGSILDSNDDRHEATKAGEVPSGATGTVPSESALRDSRLLVNLQPGRYLITLQDAHDRGGPAHPYRLTLQPADR